MRRILLGATLAMVLAAPAHAQRKLQLHLGGGASLTNGRFSDASSPGWHALASVGLSTLMQPIGLRLDAAHNQFTARAAGPDETVTSATLNVSYRLPMTNSRFSPYVITGAGGYRFDCTGAVACGDGTLFGWNAGLGTKFSAMRMKGLIETRWHAVNTKSGNTRYIPLTFALTF